MLPVGKREEWHQLKVDLSGVVLPVAYKYGVYNFKRDAFVRFEEGENRELIQTSGAKSVTILHDGFVRLPFKAWRGAGVAIPVFSLRSQNSFGVGEFLDIKLLADWAASAGLKIIQLLPVNDTSATLTNQDSYPYAAISAFALHPVYINLQKVAGKKYAPSIKSLQKKQKQLNALADVDYQQVVYFKMNTLRELYEAQGDEFLKEDDYKSFFTTNGHWLKPYAAFCLLRDRNNTADFGNWKTTAVYNADEIEKLTATKSKTAREVRFYYFVQYHLHLQLKEAVDYTHKKGIALKGDIPIGIFRNSVDAWTAPELYNMQEQAGAPPDDFAVKGQNWGFPTYNWKKMEEDSFDWWKQRFKQMSEYFDAFRIDHILGFFRIWSIPLNAVEGIMGRFVPAIPVNVSEFYQRNIPFDFDRYCTPYITDVVLQNVFGSQSSYVKETFLDVAEGTIYRLKEAFNTQRKVEAYFENDVPADENDLLKNGLYDLISNVILFEEGDGSRQQFHFRISVEQTTSFQYLEDGIKHSLYGLYINYFYHRQDEFWKEEALRKLPYLKEATNMLVCGEDLGMVPHTVPAVMRNLGILSLEIQRMPKNPHTRFFHPKDAPYLSVITPSTHDMSTIRGWWEEDRARTGEFYHSVLESGGEAPYFCEAWINRAIVLQHLYSPAMWSIFQLQDLLGMSENLRRQNPHEERINIPADPKHYWRYRMHISLEDLIKETEFNAEVKDYVSNSGRG
jgi:4-alpha-glucanotransferase